MPIIKRKNKLIQIQPVFDPSTDKPLRYFSTKEVFVRSTAQQNYKLFCEHKMVLLLTRDGLFYKYPAYKIEHEEYAEAFIGEYAPHVQYNTIKYTLTQLAPVYIGTPDIVTL